MASLKKFSKGIRVKSIAFKTADEVECQHQWCIYCHEVIEFAHSCNQYLQALTQAGRTWNYL